MDSKDQENTRARMADFSLLTWIRFMRVVKKIGTNIGELMQDEGLSRHQFGLLVEIYYAEGLKQQDYAEKLQVTKGNIVQHLDRLVNRGLLERRREGRINYIYLTATGKNLAEKILPIHDNAVRNNISVLSQKELKDLYGLLRKLDHSL